MEGSREGRVEVQKNFKVGLTTSYRLVDQCNLHEVKRVQRCKLSLNPDILIIYVFFITKTKENEGSTESRAEGTPRLRKKCGRVRVKIQKN